MKILIIQLARFGDTLQTWPAIKAIKRSMPEAEIHVLARKRFSEPFKLNQLIHKIWELDSEKILTSLLVNNEMHESVDKLEVFLQEMENEHFDKIVNLSFSPASSYLVTLLAHEDTKVVGYTRFSDGSFALQDEVSAYFYAQVGEVQANRLGLSSLFAQMCDVDLIDEDWDYSSDYIPSGDVPYIVIHVGTSQSFKTITHDTWINVLKNFNEEFAYQIILVGSRGERMIAEAISSACSNLNIKNLVGETNFQQLFYLIRGACLVLGGDSAPMHIAELMQRPCVNISFESLNFWETAPRSPSSRIMVYKNPSRINAEQVAEEVLYLLNGHHAKYAMAVSDGPNLPFRLLGKTTKDLEWNLIQVIYFGVKSFDINSSTLLEGLYRLEEVLILALEQLQVLQKDQNNRTALLILDRVDELLEAIGRHHPSLSVFIRWIEAEKIKIGPLSFEGLLIRTTNVYLGALQTIKLCIDKKDIQLNV